MILPTTEVFVDISLDDGIVRCVGLKSQRLGPCSLDLLWPAVHNLHNEWIRFVFDQFRGVLAGGAFQRGDHLLYGYGEAGHVEGPGSVAYLIGRQCCGSDKEAHRRLGTSHRAARIEADGTDGGHVRNRLADDARNERRGSLIGSTRANGDGGETNADAIKEPLAGVVGDEQFADCFLCAVRTLGSAGLTIGNDGGEGRAKDSERTGKDQTWGVAGIRADGLQQEFCALHIDRVSKLKVLLCVA
mmetsp:Transcript_18976/g.44943  ORF Transcript_18976/g.44943 Transcript_18976/m.44943 type:complete len:244 (+) Transcript_18976:225-956(+)